MMIRRLAIPRADKKLPSSIFSPCAKLAAISGTLIGSTLSGGALAQEEPLLEEIVITAERREVNLQDTPISATVLSGDSLIEKGVDNVDEIQQVAPGIAINTYNRSTFINIRGVGIAQSAPTSNPGVAYYLDGVFFPHEQFIGQSFYDLGSVEVIRGPQGTLTGQNSTGGAVYVRTPDPDPEALSGYIDQTVGTDGWFRTVGAINAPTGGDTALRAAAIYENKDGFVDNLGPSAGMDPGSSELLSFRVNWAANLENQSYNVRLDYFDLETGNIAVKDRTDPNSDPFEINYDGRSYLDQKGYRFSLEGKWDIADSMQLRALLSDQDGYTKDQSDGDRAQDTPVPIGLPANGANRAAFPGRISRARTDFETSILELNLLSNNDGPVQWVVGGFYMTDDVPVELFRDNYSNLDFTASNSNIVAEAENTSKSVFGQVDWSVTESLILTGGYRYSQDEQAYTRFALPGPPPPGCFPCTTTQESDEETGRLGIQYYTGADTMLYATYSKGYKAGGVNLDPRLDFFKPEKNKVFEAGIKTTVDDGRLRLNANIFMSDYQDIQLASLTDELGGPALPITQNAASAEISGIELEMQGAYDAVNFNLGISYLDGTFADDVCINNTNRDPLFVDPVCVGQLGLPVGNEQVNSGDELPFSPQLSANGGVQYEMEFGNMYVIPRFQISYIDEQLATPFRTNETVVESRVVADFKVIVEPNEHWYLEGFVTNIRDEEYIASQIQNSSSADGGAIYGAPRQIGLRAKYEF